MFSADFSGPEGAPAARTRHLLLSTYLKTVVSVKALGRGAAALLAPGGQNLSDLVLALPNAGGRGSRTLCERGHASGVKIQLALPLAEC
jgi:hypothetical protein